MPMPVRVGIVDSGVAPAQEAAIFASCAVVRDRDGHPALRPATGDRVGHGAAVAAIVLALAPAVRLLNAQAFDARRCADAACVAAAVDWCLRQDARVINLSFGLRTDDAALRAACAAAATRGAIVVAAAPARGAPVYPAAYSGVVAVSGDARCAATEWSAIAPGLFGAAPSAADGITPGGASYAAARMAGHAARFLASRVGAGADQFRSWLADGAAYRGRERH